MIHVWQHRLDAHGDLSCAGPQPKTVAAPATIDPELAEFKAEIGAIEAETEQANRVDTPPPDQQRFQDDDGTIYVWDSNVRRFVPAGETAPSTSYDVADMVYEAEDEKIPAMPAPIQVCASLSSLFSAGALSTSVM